MKKSLGDSEVKHAGITLLVCGFRAKVLEWSGIMVKIGGEVR